MKDISIYLQPVEIDISSEEETIGANIIPYIEGNFPVLDQPGIALIFVPEYRNDSTGEKQQKDGFRTSFYALQNGYKWKHVMYDLGTILPGEKTEDTYHAVKITCQELIKKDIIPFIIGGSQDLTLAQYTAYHSLEQLINVTSVDKTIDFKANEDHVTATNWIHKILVKHPSHLFNYSNLAGQKPYISNKTLKLFDDLYFDALRLGEINQEIENTEPHLRNTDLLSVDLTSIRASEMQNSNYATPNGLYANELCRILRYAGISDKLTSVGIYHYYSENNATTDQLVAELIWYFSEGYANRKGDFPISTKKDYKKFTIFLEELNEEMIFYKSNRSARWWMEIPYPGTASKYMRHQMVPCSYAIYQKAMQGEIPNLWWKTYQKMTI